MHSEGFFKGTFLKIVLTILVTVFMLCMALLIYFQAYSADLVFNYTADQLYQIKHSTDMMLENARRTILSYSSNGDVLKLINQAHTMDSLELYETLRRIEKLGLSQVQPQYICYYNQDTDSVFYQAKQYPSDTFPDQALVEMLRTDAPFTNYYPMLRKAPDYERLYQGAPADHNMYTFVFTSSPDGTMKNAVILNIPVDNIDRSIGAAYAAIGNEIIIVNTAMEAVRGNSRFPYGTVIQDEPAITGLVTNGESNGYIIDSISGEKYLVAYAKSDVADWKYLRLTPYKTIANAAWSMIGKSLLTALCLLVPLLAIGALVTRNISRAYGRRLDEVEKQYKQQSDTRYAARQHYLHQIMLENLPIEEENQSKFDIQVRAQGPYLILMVAINQYASYCLEHSAEERSQFYQWTVNAFTKKFSEIASCEMVYLDHGVFAVWIQGEAHDAGAIWQAVDDMQALAHRRIGRSLSAVLSDAVPTAQELPLCISACQEALTYRLFFGENMHVPIREVRKVMQCTFEYTDGDINNLTDLLLLGKEDALKDKCHALLESATVLPYSALQVMLMRVVMSLQAAIVNKGFDTSIVRLEEWMDFVRDVSEYPTMAFIEHRMLELLHDILKRMDKGSRIKDLRFEAMIQSALRYVTQEYADISLSPDAIALKLNMSPEYFKKVYKSNTGISFSEEISRYRLSVAKRKLVETGVPIADIAQQCGFANVNYFYTLFKKKYGVTAAEYRRIHSKVTAPMD